MRNLKWLLLAVTLTAFGIGVQYAIQWSLDWEHETMVATMIGITMLSFAVAAVLMFVAEKLNLNI
ncbi:MAG: hypothetical protein A3C30_02610 [Candidatus Levybacteria bacterium RIFCSPHIGHO2_02_FULL_40_18]|nr:MAG: hypothetical protein A2869_05365 [Candidatus Levybacteria bacterium RIFCSPHIGHO2_01_FULL_40_58]OGH26867.1 MAG: hypothetical protein A3C30_02610 [Candidatus Levybacteria bacterium RIFCSPHIGHO2_02_FULL_40_18]OGH31989.1 MAG: hypothetical protein A3E43_03590 [Candidatus Levybacteria bacterium RIFCSPHIGHO2_12_FULL_40_31]OGH40889.1 MAG: hypothetical protein A2894_04810 [Candidatus Levybacteria bacterium RIFCSPLOWO2_01_FULL_40_64]OGH49540.1 MAG: hypothetical protein A3I54_00135 [Candidatus Lev